MLSLPAGKRSLLRKIESFKWQLSEDALPSPPGQDTHRLPASQESNRTAQDSLTWPGSAVPHRAQVKAQPWALGPAAS